ncbi:hypothetical protein [Mucilaginibacter aquatilis]|uniref:Uncharacterized protein n=1 Tax=Mucilaginibacter aquatilis TaxID=1517760 RepID=A0A6I4IBQ4_9SPHI|nr:hypothetical protein [Mucilaginibacter aquatilis]MVN92532.1 hypothetical protein [Mucilaginibacter aquatilis]
MTSSTGLKISTLIFFVIVFACIVAAINQFLIAGGLLQSRTLGFEATFTLYFAASLALLWLTGKKIEPQITLSLLFVPIAALTIKGLLTSWGVLYPYHFPLQTLIVLSAEVIAYVISEFNLTKKLMTFVVSVTLLFFICSIAMKDPYVEAYTGVNSAVEGPPAQALTKLKEQLIDTGGHRLAWNSRNYYIINFGNSTSAASQIKTQFLKSFALKLPTNIKIVNVYNARLEGFDEFKARIKPDLNDPIIYGYLFDDKLIQQIGVSKFPGEVLVGPGFKFIRLQNGFYSFDAITYADETLGLIKK